MVILVNVSPAREPNALEPPAPPKAPARPPPLPRWISTSTIRNRPATPSTMFSTNGTHAGGAAHNGISTLVISLSFPVLGGLQNAIIREAAARRRRVCPGTPPRLR